MVQRFGVSYELRICFTRHIEIAMPPLAARNDIWKKHRKRYVNRKYVEIFLSFRNLQKIKQ